MVERETYIDGTLLEEQSREIELDRLHKNLVLCLLVNVEDLEMQNGLAEFDGDVLSHLESDAIVFGCKVSLVIDDSGAIV